MGNIIVYNWPYSEGKINALCNLLKCTQTKQQLQSQQHICTNMKTKDKDIKYAPVHSLEILCHKKKCQFDHEQLAMDV